MQEKKEKKEKPKKIISKVLSDGTMLEMIINKEGKSRFAIYTEGLVIYEDEDLGYRPWSAGNGLITSEVLLFPSKATKYGTNKELFDQIVEYLKKYIELPEHFYNIVAVYCMMTWVYEQFSEVAYLRVLGDFGTGKTRFIKTIGRICYKPMIASGSATPSSLFRILDLVGGTFVFDEADFQGSDMWKEMVKILNSGHTFGGPVLRSERDGKDGEFSPRAFKVFGPKVIASRNHFGDEALESRCLTEVLIPKKKLKSVPIALPRDEFESDGLKIRNRLLMFRFKNYKKIEEFKTEVLTKLDPRMQQTSLSVLAVAQSIGDKALTDGIVKFLEDYNKQLQQDRGNSQEVDVLLCLAKLMLSERCNGQDDPHQITKFKGIKVAVIAKLFNDAFADEYGMDRGHDSGHKRGQVSPKKIGEIIRRKLKIITRRQKGGFCVPLDERNKIKRLMSRYGLTEDSINEIRCWDHTLK